MSELFNRIPVEQLIIKEIAKQSAQSMPTPTATSAASKVDMKTILLIGGVAVAAIILIHFMEKPCAEKEKNRL